MDRRRHLGLRCVALIVTGSGCRCDLVSSCRHQGSLLATNAGRSESILNSQCRSTSSQISSSPSLSISLVIVPSI
ncbi:hypothetical protein BDV25DRAFT_157030 [Aspergillus avenaceus]|uniref:Secreted protein n=1 Tax=Aspergillus avenaceus TaxID=36643 RepID=A0A5N6TRU5_ASPAV|nr:hypothetical protein BDV25DRAFT_157030 [Aspergillus avenaceus]